MEKNDFEHQLEKLLQADLSVGTEAFRDTLLTRCLSVLNEDEGVGLEDGDLGMLAAAGDAFSLTSDDSILNNTVND